MVLESVSAKHQLFHGLDHRLHLSHRTKCWHQGEGHHHLRARLLPLAMWGLAAALQGLQPSIKESCQYLPAFALWTFNHCCLGPWTYSELVCSWNLLQFSSSPRFSQVGHWHILKTGWWRMVALTPSWSPKIGQRIAFVAFDFESLLRSMWWSFQKQDFQTNIG